MSDVSPIAPFLEKQGVLILDGGLATELENRGYDLNHPLWSARLLASHPEAIRDVHLAYLEAGANCIVSSGYQATIPGFMDAGMSQEKAESLLKLTVALACDAREEYMAAHSEEITLTPLVAAGIGPYGAYLADGSEYHGNYAISRRKLLDFHKRRWETYAGSAADLVACETIPSIEEAEVMLDLIHETPGTFAWISFSCKDGIHISDGTPIGECAALLKDSNQVVALGINCTAPKYIASLIEQIRKVAPSKPVVVYPNSGETYDAASRSWIGQTDSLDFGKAAYDWMQQGAGLIGGCCRTGPDHIRAIHKNLVG